MAKDSSGNGINATIHGSPTMGVATGAAGIGNGFSLNGSNQYMESAGSSLFADIASEISLEGWFNLTPTNGGFLLSQPDASGGANSFEMVVGTCGGTALPANGQFGAAIWEGSNYITGNWINTNSSPV